MDQLTYIPEGRVQELINWPDLLEALDMAFRSVCSIPEGSDSPTSSQPGRSFTWGFNKKGVLLTMPAFLGNYKLPSTTQDKVLNTMGCKLVTSFPGNTLRSPTLPSILANIMLMNAETGQLEVIVEATTITNWRTAAASLVATKHLYFNRPEMIQRDSKELILSIVGCGVQGEIHSIGFASQFSQIKEIRFYNRTTARRDALHMKMEGLRRQFKNPQLILSKTETPAECVTNADLVVIATNSSTPLIEKKFLKNDVHINAIGAGMNHHSELHPDIYESSQVYTDHWEGAKTELAGIMDKLTGIVGEVILGQKPQPENGITVFQSMGMGVEDIGVAQMIFEKHQQILQQSAP